MKVCDKKKNARPVVGATEQAAESEFESQDSKTYFNEESVKRQCLSDVLLHGKDNAIPGRDLVSTLGLKDLRELTQLVERERKVGFPICATTDAKRPGYYITDDPAELAAYIKSLDRRIKNVGETRQRMEETLMSMTGQEMLK